MINSIECSGNNYFGDIVLSSYQSASTVAGVQAHRAQLDVYNALFITSASLTGVGLGGGTIFLLTAPKPDKIDIQVKASIDQLRKLEAKKIIEGIK